jgi:excisionase family DNA binding protein
MKNINSPDILQRDTVNDIQRQSLFDKRIWTIKDVAEFLDLSVSYIYNLTSRNDIPFRKKGKRGKLYFLPEEIEEWVNEG